MQVTVFTGAKDENLREELHEGDTTSVKCTEFHVLPPQEDLSAEAEWLNHPDETRVGMEFTDANGVSWWREGGDLEEIQERRS